MPRGDGSKQVSMRGGRRGRVPKGVLVGILVGMLGHDVIVGIRVVAV